MPFEGILVQKTYAEGSKSEREAIFLKFKDGRELLLLRIGGNHYQDEELLSLLGKGVVVVEGVLEENNFYFTKINKLG